VPADKVEELLKAFTHFLSRDVPSVSTKLHTRLSWNGQCYDSHGKFFPGKIESKAGPPAPAGFAIARNVLKS
jgi:hypothetical protein